MNFRRIFRIARKDFGEQIRNWRIVFYGLYLVIWFGALAIIQWSGIFPLVIVVSAPQDSALLGEVTALRTSIPFFVDVVEAPEAGLVPNVMQETEADLGVVAGADFDRALQDGEQAPIEFIRAEGSWGAAILQEVVRARVNTLAPPQAPVLQVEESTVTIKKQERRRVSILPIIPLGQISVLGALMIFLILVDQGSNALFVVPYLVQEERKTRTLEALLVSPLSHLELLLGKFFGAWAYGLMTSGFFLIPIVALAPNLVLFLLAVLLSTAVLNLFGLLIGVVFTNQQAANSFVSIFSIPWVLTTYIGWLDIDGPWGLDLLINALPTVQMGHAMILSFSGDIARTIPPLMILSLQFLIIMALMVGILKRQENT